MPYEYYFPISVLLANNDDNTVVILWHWLRAITAGETRHLKNLAL
jgi:hypothetical protein